MNQKNENGKDGNLNRSSGESYAETQEREHDTKILKNFLIEIATKPLAERVTEVEGTKVKMLGRNDWQEASDVAGIKIIETEIGPRLMVPEFSHDENAVSKVQNKFGDLMDLIEYREYTGNPLGAKEKEKAFGEFRSVPFIVEMDKELIKRVDELDEDSFKNMLCRRNEVQYRHAQEKIWSVLGKKFQQYVLENEQAKFEAYYEAIGKKTDINPSEKQIKNMLSFLKRRGVDTKNIFPEKAVFEDFWDFNFKNLDEEEKSYVMDAIKKVKSNSKRYIKYGQGFLSLLKTRQKDAIKELIEEKAIGRVQARYNEIIPEIAQRQDEKLNLLAEIKALGEGRIGRVSLKTYEGRKDFKKQIGMSYDEKKLLSEMELTPLQELLRNTLHVDRFESLDSAVSGYGMPERTGELITGTMFRMGYELDGEEVIVGQKLEQEDTIGLKDDLISETELIIERANEIYGEKEQHSYFSDNELDNHKLTIALANKAVTGWAEGFFKGLAEYVSENKGKLVRGKQGTEEYSRAQREIELTEALFNAGIIGKPDFRKRTRELYALKKEGISE
ncbi:hypothetical protein GOV06_03505 [Candidatus Woesearchaeota archaeon]|nr:hypothetical protein [Candidatus Woesearchaeota archaeon]